MDRVNTGAPGGAPRRKKKKKNAWRAASSVMGKFLLVLSTLAAIGVLTIIIFAQFFLSYAHNILVPSLDEVNVEDITLSLASTIYCKDEAGEWIPLRVIHQAEGNRELVEYEELPDHLVKALVAIEDKRFWDHHGVDWISTASSIKDTLLGDSTRGGSTLTQQVLRNITQDKQVTVLRKFREIFRALEFEKHTSKQDILTLYLNTVTFGHAQGIGMAAKVYFGKDVSELTLAESAAIIAITNNPSLYDPFFDIEYVQSDGSVKTPRDFNKKRQTDILWTMWDQGIIDEATYTAAKDEFLMFTDTPEYAALHPDAPEADEDGETTPPENDNGVLALHTGTYTWFEDAVISDAIELIMEQQTVSREVAADKLYGGGYHIYTTLDLHIQDIVDSVYEDPSNFDYPSPSGQSLSSAITVVDPYTGDVVAMAGGVGLKEGNRVLNLARTPRQCGSSIKPVSVYAPAIDAGLIGPASIIDDYPLRLNSAGTGGYPRNDNNHYSGSRTISYGVQWSINCVATRVLDKLGLANSFEFMENNLGFDLAAADLDYGPLAMGGLTNGVTTEQMAAAFGAFVNEGIYNKPRTIIRIESNDHNEVIVDNPVDSRVAMKESTAYLINNLLKGVVNGGTGGGASFSGMTIAGKTGTASKNLVRYFTGYTPYYSAAVWTGYRDRDEPIKSDGNPAAKIWKKVMQQIHADLPNKSFFERPDGITSVSVCADCGLLVSDLCSQDYRGSRVVSGEMPVDAVPKETCTCHVEVSICTDPETGEVHLAGDYCPEETVTTRVMLSGREFLMLHSNAVNADGSVAAGAYIPSDDQEAHLTWLRMQGPCPIHDETYLPEGPGENEEPVPGDPGYQLPPWLNWPSVPDDPENPETGGQTTPGTPDSPDEPEDSDEPAAPVPPSVPPSVPPEPSI